MKRFAPFAAFVIALLFFGAAECNAASTKMPTLREISPALQQADEFLEGLSLYALDFVTGDGNRTARTVTEAVRHIGAPRVFNDRNYGWGIGGITCLILGLIGVAACIFKLIFTAFELSYVWGVALLANGFVLFTPFFGDSVRFVLFLPYVLTAYFIVRNWDETRTPFVLQLFSWNLATLGYLMLKLM
jgi:hypothetical protein